MLVAPRRPLDVQESITDMGLLQNTTITPEDICGARGGPECLKWAKECMTETAQMASMHVDRAGAEMAYCAFKKNTQAKVCITSQVP
jgi:hypothetical protein